MANTGLHRGLELRLEALAERIAELRQKMSRAKGLEKIEEFGEIEELEQRHKFLEGRLQELNREGPGFRQNRKAEIEKVADDLTATIENFVMKLDSDEYRRKPSPRQKR